MGKPRFDRVVLGAAIVVAGIGLLVAAAGGPPDTFWTVDDAGKALVLRQLRRDPIHPALPYPGAALDPTFRFYPQPLRGAEPYAVLRDGRILSQYASPFVWLALPLAGWPRGAGRALLPALGAGIAVLVTGLLAARLAGRSGGTDAGAAPARGRSEADERSAAARRLAAGYGTGDRRAAARTASALLAIASPLLFYASVFWEHTWTIALVGGAFAALARPDRRRAGLAGLLLGGACLLREELALLLAAVVIVAPLEGVSGRDVLRLGAGGAAGVVGRGLFNAATSGSWLGVHVGVNRPEPFAHSGDAVRQLLLGPGFSGVADWVPAAALLVLLAGSRAPRRVGAGLLAVGAAAVVAVAAAGWRRFPGGEDSALALIRSNSALSFLPWTLVAPFLRGRSRATSKDDASQDTVGNTAPDATPPVDDAARAARLLGRATLLFLALFLALVPARSITGVHPGPRMLLPLLPFAAALAAARVRASRLAVILLTPMLLVSAAWNVRSLELLADKRALAGEIAAVLRARPEQTVVTNLFWLPTEMSALWDSKRFHLMWSSRDLQTLVDRARAAGETSILAAIAPGGIPATPVAAIRREGFAAFAVDVQVLNLTSLPAPPPISPGEEDAP